MLKQKVRFLKKASPRVVNGPTSSGRNRPEPDPDSKNPARLTTLHHPHGD